MKDRRWAWSAAITAVYAVTVTWAASHHEPWRDEVVPLSIARHAHSLGELAAPLRFESHPIGWYLVLWGAWAALGTTVVLKAASLASATGAVFLLNRSPLPWWIALPFTFSFFPLYQFSVVSRGYGLEMLALFACCTLHPHRRTHPLALGLGLAVLANTEAFGAIMAGAATVMLAVEHAMRSAPASSRDHHQAVGGQPAEARNPARESWSYAAIALCLVGILAAVAVSFPDATHRGTAIRDLDLGSAAAGVGRALLQPVAHASVMTVLPVASLGVWAYFAYLARTPPVLCFAAVGVIGMEVLFQLVTHLRAAWHYGNVLLVLVAAAWLDASGSLPSLTLPPPLARAHRWLGTALALALVVVLAHQVALARAHLALETRLDYSANRRFAALLHGDPTLADATLMGEPDAPLWSVPYYADNRIYLAREGTYRDWGVFAPPRQPHYDLAALLAAAHGVRDDCRCPVAIALGFDVGQLGIHTEFPGTPFQETFEITAPARDAFLAATRLVADLGGPTITDERYAVYVLR